MRQKNKLRILASVFNKSGLTTFINQLNQTFSLEIVSTGGTAKLLSKAGFKVTKVENITNFPEILSGRVKTLHPKVFGGILADKRNSQHCKQIKKYTILPFDMVIVNLYPFEKTIKTKGVTLNQAIEQIDIGGVSLLRAAAKNFQSVISVCDPNDYLPIAKSLKLTKKLSFEQFKRYAAKVFKLTSQYDKLIATYLNS